METYDDKNIFNSFVNSLDLHPIKLGENNKPEYVWSNILQEKILQFSYQLVRTSNRDDLNQKHREILHEIFEKNDKEMINLMFKMIAHTRDIVKGKGEYNLSYMMLFNWCKYNVNEVKKMILYMVSSNFLETPYGSWKDIKYFLDYCRKEQYNVDAEWNQNIDLVRKFAISLVNMQIYTDNKMLKEGLNISLCAKWVPRENKKFGNQFGLYAADYYREQMNFAEDKELTPPQMSYAKMTYRKLLTRLNRSLDTAQIKMCKKQWSLLIFNRLTSITLDKQKYALMFEDKNNKLREDYEDNYSDKQDRMECRRRFIEWKNTQTTLKGTTVDMFSFVKSAIQLIAHPSPDIIDVLNKQWNGSEIMKGEMDFMIPMVDTSGSMSCDNNIPLYNAIGLGIKIAERSLLGKRCLTFSNDPTWINMEQTNSFVDMVKMVRDAEWGMNTNFNAAMELILKHIVASKLSFDDVSKLKLVVLSDMQFDDADINSTTIDKEIEDKFSEAGIKISGKPYRPPRIIFWNLRKTDGFPSVSYRPGVCMISGYSPNLIEQFIKEGQQALEEYTPFNVLKGMLNIERYNILL